MFFFFPSSFHNRGVSLHVTKRNSRARENAMHESADDDKNTIAREGESAAGKSGKFSSNFQSGFSRSLTSHPDWNFPPSGKVFQEERSKKRNGGARPINWTFGCCCCCRVSKLERSHDFCASFNAKQLMRGDEKRK